ncbi:MAG: AEC family transporter [Velocimicrobium sp.]
MTYALLTLEQVTAMLCIAVITIVIYKRKLIEKESSKSFSNLLLMVINPVLIFESFQQEYTKERLQGFLIAIILSCVTFLFMIMVSSILIRKQKNEEAGVERFACIYSNCGFVGIPLVNALFGPEGVFYLAAFMLVFNIFVWTQGLMLITGNNDKKQILAFFKNPMFAAIVLGLAAFLWQVKLPSVIDQVVSSLSVMNTPLAMIVAGMAVADANILSVLKKKRIYYIAAIKLLIIPILFVLITARLPIPFLIKATVAIAITCPTATTGTMFAIRYDKDSAYMAELFSITTILSIFTIPIVIYLIQTI